MDKKIVHVISHSHLDREWYLPLVSHQFNLVDLIDNLLILSKDHRFNSFHLDGQIIPLEDYFKIRPEKREDVISLIKDGKLKIGPWYILQDDFLISSESNLRDLQIGTYESNRYLKDIKKDMWIGYFPDTFGNAGQIPQILKRSQIEVAYFGRGVKATGFNNAVFEDYTSNNSEMYWKSKDGSEVLGILFANWYSNGNEIPSDREDAKKFWDKKLKDAEKYASTKHLLFMNGCDHQPLQMDILDAIDIANEIYEDYHFIHSNLFDYYKELKKEIEENKINLSEVNGELRSQKTDGWWTLQGTNSNRVYLKEYNKKCEMLLEELLEPLSTSLGYYQINPKINYLWKTLLSNHPHDSICGCGIDSIHKGMEERFKEVYEGANFLIKESLDYYTKNANTKHLKDDYLFTVHNNTQYGGLKETEVFIDIKKVYFDEMYFKDIYSKLKDEKKPKTVKIYFEDELVYETKIKDVDVIFDYELPKDKFRKPFFAIRAKFNALLYIKPFTRKTFKVEFSNEEIIKEDNFKIYDNTVETKFLKLTINDDGTFNLLDKKVQKEFKKLGIIENTGDVGNEYIFRETLDNKIYSTSFKSNYSFEKIDENTLKVLIKDRLLIPISADYSLIEAQKSLQEVNERNIYRDKQKYEMEIIKEIEIKSYSDTLKMNIKFKNEFEDHRLRVLFPTNIENEYVYAESIYEVAKRSIKPSVEWKNPDTSQNMNRFVNLRDEKYGITIGSMGIAEYEIVENSIIALTLGRFTGEMGDWGYFKTVDSQGKRNYDLSIYINIHGIDYISSYHKVLEKRKIYLSNQIYPLNNGNIDINETLNIDLSNNILTAYKFNYNNEKILRICNYEDNSNTIKIEKAVEYNILEDTIVSNEIKDLFEVKPYEIRTFGVDCSAKNYK